MSEQKMIPAKVAKRELPQRRFKYTVIVTTDTEKHADQVMGERLGFDEQYEDESGVEFDYSIEQESNNHPEPITPEEQEDVEIRRLDTPDPNPEGDAPDDVLFFGVPE